MINPNNHRKALIFAAVLGAAAVLGLGLIGGANSAEDPKTEPAPMVVQEGERIRIPENSPMRSHLTVAVVGESAAPHVLNVPAVVEADPAAVATILPPLSGRITYLAVNVGDQVRANQVLAVLDSPDLTQAVTDVAKARDAEHLAHDALQRAEGVNEAGANANKDLDQAKSAEIQAKAEEARAEGRLKAIMPAGAGANPRELTIRAPVSGVVTALNVGLGSMINDVTQPVMTLANLDSVWITARVPEQSAAALTKGVSADVTLSALPGQTLHAIVTSVSAVLDADSRRLLVRMRVPNHDQHLKPNMYASVGLHIPLAGTPVVPSSAIIMNNDSTTVLVEVAPYVFVRRVVQLGDEDGDTVRVTSGLKAGERVVVRGGVLLND